MPELDPSYVLFPNDAPKEVRAPEWVKVQRAEAEQRLMGQHDNSAALVFPNEAKTGEAAPSAGDGDDPASVLFKDDAARRDVDYERVVGGELDQVAIDAAKDGDNDRADELKAATAALTENFRTAGTDPAEITEAFQIIRQSAGLNEMTAEQREQSLSDGLSAVEQAGISDGDLAAARRFVRDLETVSPGTIASLERHGAGNNIKLIQAAVKEARRRKY